MVQLVDQHPGSKFILLMFGKISERPKILNNIATHIANRTDEDSRPELAAILAACLSTAEKNALTFPVLSDVGRKVAPPASRLSGTRFGKRRTPPLYVASGNDPGLAFGDFSKHQYVRILAGLALVAFALQYGLSI